MDNRAFRGMNPLPLFWILMVQNGEGCDYTVGCGLRAMPLRARTLEAARVEATRFFMGKDEDGYRENGHYVDPKSDSALLHAVLVTGSEFLPMGQWRADCAAEQVAQAKAAREAEERTELERLQKKYGK